MASLSFSAGSAAHPLATPPMKFRKLRIAWSVTWGVVAVLFVVSWVRSYCGYDAVTWARHNSSGLLVDSCKGRFGIAIFRSGDLRVPIDERVYFEVTHGSDDWFPKGKFGFGTETGDLDLPFHFMPYCFPFSLAAAFTAAPWFRTRFSLRTLLIATTLVALGLGIATWVRG